MSRVKIEKTGEEKPVKTYTYCCTTERFPLTNPEYLQVLKDVQERIRKSTHLPLLPDVPEFGSFANPPVLLMHTTTLDALKRHCDEYRPHSNSLDYANLRIYGLQIYTYKTDEERVRMLLEFLSKEVKVVHVVW